VWFGHSVSCLWYAIAFQLPSDTGASWLGTYLRVGQELHEYGELEDVYLYLTAFHWSMAQLTLGANELVPSSTGERIFSILMLFLGLLFSSTLVSGLSATLIDFQMRSGELNEKLRTLRRFLGQCNVDPTVALRVRQQAEQRLAKKPMLTEKQVTALEVLSTTMRSELRFDIFKDHLLRHPIFRVWTNLNVATVKELCADDSLDFQLFQPADDVFLPGEQCENAYYLVDGILRYTQDPESSMVDDDERLVTEVTAGAWLCEAALWSQWVHVGHARAETQCQLLVLPSTRVLDVLRKHGILRDITNEYGKEFHRRLIEAKPPHASYPTDLEVPFTEFGDIVATMNSQIQHAIGLDALLHTSRSRFSPFSTQSEAHQKLKDEVLEGRSVVVLNKEGDPERVVSVTALKLQGPSGIFMQLGKQDGVCGAISAKVILPGTKQQKCEMPIQAAMRVLREELSALQDIVEITSTERMIERKESTRVQLSTKYIRTEVHMHLTKAISTPARTASWPFYKTSSQPATRSGSLPLERRISERRPSGRISERRRASESLAELVADREVFVFPLYPDSEGEASQEPGASQSAASQSYAAKQGRTQFFAWLTQEEIDTFKMPESEAVLRHWLAAIARCEV